MGKLISPDLIQHGVRVANKIWPLTPDAQEAVTSVQKAILGLEQTPDSLAEQFNLHTPPRAKPEIARVLSHAFRETDPVFAQATISKILPVAPQSHHDTSAPPAAVNPVPAERPSVKHWWETINVPPSNPT